MSRENLGAVYVGGGINTAAVALKQLESVFNADKIRTKEGGKWKLTRI